MSDDNRRVERLDIRGTDPRQALEYVREGIDAATKHCDVEIIIERVDTDDDDVIYRCTECGHVDHRIGRLHAHCEQHRGLFGLQLPWRYGDYDALAAMTEVLRVEEAAYSEVGVDGVR